MDWHVLLIKVSYLLKNTGSSYNWSQDVLNCMCIITVCWLLKTSAFVVHCSALKCNEHFLKVSLAIVLYHFQVFLETEVAFSWRGVRMSVNKFDSFLWLLSRIVLSVQEYRDVEQKSERVLHLKNASLRWAFGEVLEEWEKFPLFYWLVMTIMKEQKPYFSYFKLSGQHHREPSQFRNTIQRKFNIGYFMRTKEYFPVYLANHPKWNN